jgi:hypothetical protein
MECRSHRTGPDSDEIPRRRRTGLVRDNQTDLDCGSGRPDERSRAVTLDEVKLITCPLVLHFAEEDKFSPPETVSTIPSGFLWAQECQDLYLSRHDLARPVLQHRADVLESDRSDRDQRGTDLRRDLRGGRRSWTTDVVCSDDLRQTLLTPPSTTMSEPLVNELSSEARKKAAAASSSGCASLSMGV